MKSSGELLQRNSCVRGTLRYYLQILLFLFPHHFEFLSHLNLPQALGLLSLASLALTLLLAKCVECCTGVLHLSYLVLQKRGNMNPICALFGQKLKSFVTLGNGYTYVLPADLRNRPSCLLGPEYA